MEQKGIKEIVEVVEALEVVAVAAKKVMADGKINLQDGPALMALGMELPKIMAAIEGIKEIPAEAKEIDAQEAVALVQKLYAVAKKVQEA